jgi:hypothetical protein
MFTFVEERQPRSVTELAYLGNHGEALPSCFSKAVAINENPLLLL